MGEVLPDGTIQGYAMICWQCGGEVAVGFYGHGTCGACGAELPRPIDSQPSEDASVPRPSERGSE